MEQYLVTVRECDVCAGCPFCPYVEEPVVVRVKVKYKQPKQKRGVRLHLGGRVYLLS